MNSLEQARELHSQGYATIFQRGKSAFQPEWNKRRRSIEDLERDYLPGLNVAVVTGLSEIDGKRLAVVDVDIRDQGHKKAAWSALQAIVGKTEPTTRTGGGGAHWWFLMPIEGFPEENKVVLSQSTELVNDKPAWTIEVLLNGHACTCAPSIHPNGKPYEWVNGRATHILDAPAPLTAAIKDAVARNGHANGTAKLTGPRLALLSAADIVPEPIEWLWNGWLASGKLHMLAGVPGTGKTTLALAASATLSLGGLWPDRTRAERKSVVIWSGEDDPKNTLVPRLLAMGADVSRIHFVGRVSDDHNNRAFDPAEDIKLLQTAIQTVGDVGLLIVDPIVSAVSGDSNKNAEVRRSLQPVVDLAIATNCAVLGITHLTKNSKDRDPLERITGSGAFGALPRIALLAARKTEEDGSVSRFMVRAKSNIGPDDGGFVYHLEQIELQSQAGIIPTSRITWGNWIEGTSREILADAEVDAGTDEQCERSDALSFLQELLEKGPVTAGVVFKETRAAGYGDRGIQRASHKLKVRRKKEGMDGGWIWELPPKATPKGPEGDKGDNHRSLSSSSPSASSSTQSGSDAEEF